MLLHLIETQEVLQGDVSSLNSKVKTEERKI
jgi:hypothetical protein